MQRINHSIHKKENVMKDQLRFPEPGASPVELIRFQEQLLKIARKTGDRRGEGNTLLGMGQLYLNLEEFETGLECYSQALRIGVEIGDISIQGYALYQISTAGLQIGIVDDNTLNMARAALGIFERIGDPMADLARALLKKLEKKK
jgi:tetratricopeptide (TPR) repeat protein